MAVATSVVAPASPLTPGSVPREDWKPVLTINSIIYGLQYLFLVSTAGVQAPVGGGHPSWLWDISWGHPVALGHVLEALGDLGRPRGVTWWPWDTS